jgi:hypothetical protein
MQPAAAGLRTHGRSAPPASPSAGQLSSLRSNGSPRALGQTCWRHARERPSAVPTALKRHAAPRVPAFHAGLVSRRAYGTRKQLSVVSFQSSVGRRATLASPRRAGIRECHTRFHHGPSVADSERRQRSGHLPSRSARNPVYPPPFFRPAAHLSRAAEPTASSTPVSRGAQAPCGPQPTAPDQPGGPLCRGRSTCWQRTPSRVRPRRGGATQVRGVLRAAGTEALLPRRTMRTGQARVCPASCGGGR